MKSHMIILKKDGWANEEIHETVCSVHFIENVSFKDDHGWKQISLNFAVKIAWVT